MKITSAQFIKGITGEDRILQSELPQIAFMGRSNAGKSSLINTITQRKELVRTSAKPGQTRQINYFLINDGWYFADLPGYGYAKASKQDREALRELILWYLLDAQIEKRKTVLILDSKVGVSATDMEILEELLARGQEVIVVANKIDKLKQSDRHKAIKEIKEISGIEDVVPFSSHTGEGKDELLKRILK